MSERAGKFPSHLRHLAPNWRQFKAMKRRELREIKQALDAYAHGCAYCPNGSEFHRKMDALLEEMKQQQSAAVWGR